MLGAALAQDIPIIVLHLTRPPIEIPHRLNLKMPSHFKAAKGAYVIKDYNDDREKRGGVIVRGTSVINELCSILPEIIENGPNIKIVAALSWGLFNSQSEEYRQSVMKEDEWLDCMVITNTSLGNMSNWVQHPIVKEYSLSPDWDNSWRFGGNLEEVIDESHLSAHWQSKAIQKFANKRKLRIDELKNSMPENIFDKMGIE